MKLSNVELLQCLLKTNSDGNLVWAGTGRDATIPDVFSSEPYLVFGFFIMREIDVLVAIERGSWPAEVHDHDPKDMHIRRSDWAKAGLLLDRNSRKMEQLAAEAQVA